MKKMALLVKRALTLAVAVAMICACLPGLAVYAEVTASGECGDDLTWVIEDGTLTISGKGEMEFWLAPWSGYREDVSTVIINDGVTNIYEAAFENFSKLNNIVIPESVTSIEGRAFKNAESLTEMIIPGNIQSIGYGAFVGCTALESVDIPNGAIDIGTRAFYECISLKYVNIPNCTNISDYAFYECEALTSVNIPNCTNISECAFYGCINLKSIDIPDSVRTIGSYAFSGCSSVEIVNIGKNASGIDDSLPSLYKLREINVDPNNATYTSVDGVLYDKNKSTIIRYPAGKEGDGYTIPDGVKNIGIGAFSSSELSILYVPDSVTDVADNAFSDCYSLVISASKDSVLKEAAANAGLGFIETGASTTIEEALGSNITCTIDLTTGKITFSGTGVIGRAEADVLQGYRKYIKHVEIEEGITGSGWGLFRNYASLKTVKLPETFESIPSRMFGNSSVESVNIPGKVQVIGYDIFENCSRLKNVDIANGVTTIEIGAFFDCHDLTSLNLPASINDIGDAFGENPSLTEVKVDPENTSYTVEDGVLYDIEKTNLIFCERDRTGDVVIPDTVTTISRYAFYGCSGISEVIIPDSVTILGYYSLTGCTGMRKISIGAGVRYINAITFGNEMSEINVSPDSKTYMSIDGVLYDKDLTSLIRCPAKREKSVLVVPDSVTVIYSEALKGCSGLEDITLPGVTSILNEDDRDEKIITLRTVLSECSRNLVIRGIYGSYVYNEINEDYPFYLIGTNTLNQGNSPVVALDLDTGIFTVSLGEDPTKTSLSGRLYKWPTNKITSVIVEDGITSVSYRLGECKNLTSIELGNSVTSVDEGTFWNCNNIVSISIGAGMTSTTWIPESSSLRRISVDPGNTALSSTGDVIFNKSGTALLLYPAGKRDTSYSVPEGVEEISEDVFKNNKTLTGIELSTTVQSIGASAFEGANISGVKLNEGLKSIGDRAFYDCENLQSINIPAGLAEIGASAFEGANISGVKLNEGLKFIGDRAFYDCENLQSVNIPAGLAEMGDYAFGSCSKLEEVTVEDGASVIGNYAFWYCSSLKSITIPESVTEIGDDAFYRISDKCIIYGVFGSYAEEYAAENGILFAEIGGSPILKGTAGDNITWELTDGVLTFSGYGKMYDYGFFESTPWSVYPDEITKAVISEGIETVGDYVFADCWRLSNITIPESVEYIGKGAFMGCSELIIFGVAGSEAERYANLYDIAFLSLNGELGKIIASGICSDDLKWEIDKNGTLKISGNGDIHDYESAWAGYSYMVKIIIIDEGVTSIGDGAFDELYEVRMVILPNSLKRIGNNAFGADIISTIEIPANVTEIDEYALSGIGNIRSITVAEGNTTYYAEDGVLFNKKENALIKYPKGKPGSKYNVPVSVKTIAAEAFYDCHDLESVYIPSSVTTIGECAFGSCYNLTSIEVADDNRNYMSEDGILFNEEKTVLIAYPAGKPETAYMIPSGVTTIEAEAFSSVENLEEITITNDVKVIGRRAFAAMRNISVFEIPASVTEIGEGAFEFCHNLEAINIDSSNSSYLSVDGVLFNKAYTELIQYPVNKKGEKYSIPSGIKTVADNAFSEQNYLVSITVPASVENLENDYWPIFDSYNLEEIVVDGGNKTYAAVDGVLFNKDLTTLITYPQGRTDETYTVPSQVKTIADGAFCYSEYLHGVIVPESVTDINRYAFSEFADIVIYGYTDSAAHKYATSYGFEFVSIGASAKPHMSVTAVRDGNEILVSVETNNIPTGAYLFAVAYSADNTMLEIVPVKNNQAVIGKENVKTVKVFAWESINGMVPICSAENVIMQ